MRHVDHLLLGYAEGIDPGDQVVRHLEGCPRCRAALEEIRRGLALARTLSPTEMPEERSAPIRATLMQVEASAARAWGWRLAAAAAAALALTAGVLAYEKWYDPEIDLRIQAEELSPFETAAVAEHRRLLAGQRVFDVESDSAAEVLRWAREKAGLVPALATFHPGKEAEQYRMRGAKLLSVGGARVARFNYQIHWRPVTLLMAQARDLTQAPPKGYVAKRIYYRFEGGLKILTWSSGDASYVLVSDLAGYGQQSCLICHADTARRQLIEREFSSLH